MENCITFTDREGLIKKIKYVLEMDRERIDQMRNKVIEYYKDYLKPKNFINKILSKKEDKITVFVITLIMKYFQNINENSIIFGEKNYL